MSPIGENSDGDGQIKERLWTEKKNPEAPALVINPTQPIPVSFVI